MPALISVFYALVVTPLMLAPLVYAVWLVVKAGRITGQGNALLVPVATAFGLTPSPYGSSRSSRLWPRRRARGGVCMPMVGSGTWEGRQAELSISAGWNPGTAGAMQVLLVSQARLPVDVILAKGADPFSSPVLSSIAPMQRLGLRLIDQRYLDVPGLGQCLVHNPRDLERLMTPAILEALNGFPYPIQAFGVRDDAVVIGWLWTPGTDPVKAAEEGLWLCAKVMSEVTSMAQAIQ